jgi:hypothetical protein
VNEVIVSESGGTRQRLRDRRYEVGHGRSWERVEEAWPALLPLLKRSPADGLATVAALKGPPFLWRELLRLAREWETGSWHERAVPWLAALCLEPEGSLRVAAACRRPQCGGPTAPPAAHSLAPGQGETIEAVHYQDYGMCYCPQEQTGGKVLKDRRLSRLLK